jgi:hypothetical protein
MNSALYFRTGSFPAGINQLTHSYSTGDNYVKAKQKSAWVAYLDSRQWEMSVMTDPGEKGNYIRMARKGKIFSRGIIDGGEEQRIETKETTYGS